uniref:Uncharacterized protein n=1 Tax=viral metagenome TaxID=1070528 RepID=A0A6C0EZC9_9ZZZZ
MASIKKNKEPNFIKPLDPKDFEISKVSFSRVLTKVNHTDLESNYVNIKYDENKFFVVARNCKIMTESKTTKINNKIYYTLFLKITDENFIKMIKSFEELLILSGYINRETWFNNNDFTINDIDIMQMLKPTLLHHSYNGYSIGSFTSFEYQNSNQITKDCLLFEKNKIVDVCFSFDKVYIKQNKFYCIHRIEKIQKIKYIGPWSIRIHNETTNNFKKFMMTILLCNDKMENSLCYDILIYIFEFLKTF